jgi:transcription elongation factor GreA
MSTEPITMNGAKMLQDELASLTGSKRQEVIKAIAEARAHGDLKENAEYHAAKEEQSHNEGRIQEIQSLLGNAEIIDIKDIKHDNKVVFGCTVKLNDLETDEIKVFKIVGHEEADIENNLLSYKSPVAKELIGKEKNDFVMVNTPKGEKSYEITEILYK